MIRTTQLSFQYPQSAPILFPDISLQANETLLICGESGSGKTTLLHLLAGLRQPTKGRIKIDEVDISNLSQTKRDQFRGKHIGIVYQQSYFIQSLNVLDNLLVSPYSGEKQKAITVSERLGIGSQVHKYSHQLSIGQQQRASIARAVMNDPKLILADEPTSALDDKSCAQVIALLKEEAQLNHAALIIVTHDNRLKSEFNSIIELQTVAN